MAGALIEPQKVTALLKYVGVSGRDFSLRPSACLPSCHSCITARCGLYQVPEGLTRRGFPNRRGSDSTWRTKEVRHVSSYTPTWGFWGGTFARPGEEDKGRSAGPTATGPGGDLRRCDPHRGGEDRWGWSPDHPGLGLAV